MAIDSKAKRFSVPGVGRPWMRSRLPASSSSEAWRHAVGNTYAGLSFVILITADLNAPRRLFYLTFSTVGGRLQLPTAAIDAPAQRFLVWWDPALSAFVPLVIPRKAKIKACPDLTVWKKTTTAPFTWREGATAKFTWRKGATAGFSWSSAETCKDRFE